MTNKKNLTTSSNCTLRIPTREEFHRYASNELSIGDFCTNYSSGYQINRVANAINWTHKNANQQRNNNYNK